MTFGTMEKIETVTVTGATAASIVFSNIPQTYNDLKVVLSARTDESGDRSVPALFFNTDTSSTTNYTYRRLYGIPTIATSSDSGNGAIGGYVSGSTATASTFGSVEFYIPNYTGSTQKSVSSDGVSETNASPAGLAITAALWNQTSAINTITIKNSASSTNFVQHTTATLYGITRVPAGAKATGGVIYDDATYWYHVFTSSGTFTPSASINADLLIVAGGGGGDGGGGGAGGLKQTNSIALTATSYTITVGAGGAATINGNNSSALGVSVTGGGRGGSPGSTNQSGANGGSGGGGSAGYSVNGSGGTGVSGEGNNGGSGRQYTAAAGYPAYGGGGGGAGTAGLNGDGGSGTNATSNANSGLGGDGLAYSSWATPTNTGVNGYYAGGGGGGQIYGTLASTAGKGGLGGGGNGAISSGTSTPGVANTGGGGGGFGTTASAGGSGIVIIRYTK